MLSIIGEWGPVMHLYFRLPADLETIMPSFKGRFEVSEDLATWELGR